MSDLLERLIVEQVPGALRAHVDEEFAYVEMEGGTVVRYRLSPEAKRVALLDREGRPLDIPLGEVDLLVQALSPTAMSCRRPGAGPAIASAS